MTSRMALALIVPLLMTGCAVGPDYERPQQSAPLPGEWTDHAARQQTMPMSGEAQLSMAAALPDSNQGDNWRWWTEFADTTLNGLVDEALLHNNNLAVAAGRVLEARALHGGAQSARWPTVEIGGTAARGKTSQQLAVFPISPYGNVFDVSANLNFEIDLWGRLSRGEEAARATLMASEQDRRSVAQGLIAEVVRSWLAIRELHLQVALTHRTIANFQHNLTTVRERYRRGLVSPLDVYLAEQNLSAAQAIGPLFQRQLIEAKRGLEILVGRYPSGAILASDLDVDGGFLSADIMPAPLSPVPAGLPSELLDRRPDLQAAEMRLHSSVARIGEAKAALYPRLSLTAGAGTK
ncbi:MAG: multidrug efflux system outer membrane protein, partial [Candidatus Krumholzibacteriia bacterium]